jgi:hypothetical protein
MLQAAGRSQATHGRAQWQGAPFPARLHGKDVVSYRVCV